MSRFRRVFAACLTVTALFVLTATAGAEVRLPAVFGSHMVLQQQDTVPIWGWADPGEKVRVKADWLEQNMEATAARDGTWRVAVRTPAAGGPYSLTVSGTNVIRLEDVLIGEVWVCSGQSNMEWSFAHGVFNGEAEVAAASLPFIRLFKVARTAKPEPQTDCVGTWEVCTPETVKSFSAVGYLFGRELARSLDVPIGLIQSSWGGTPAESWTSEASLRSLGDFNDGLDALKAEREQAGALAERQVREAEQWWKKAESLDPGCEGKWASAALEEAEEAEEAEWGTITVPGAWEDQSLPGFDGIVWLRREVDLPAAWAGRELAIEFGPIDDMDETFVNGTRVGAVQEVGRWQEARRYSVPASAVKAGKNVLAVRVVDTGGAGGLMGKANQFRLYPAGDEAGAIPLAGEWRYRAGVALDKLPKFPAGSAIGPNWPSVLYNGMIAPVVPFGIRGAIWYQGESNASRPAQYARLFPAMIRDWRTLWNRPDFPFYFVQIAPYNYNDTKGNVPALRDAQRRTLDVPNTGMVVTLDIGDVGNIHPANKQEVGRRLALWALAKTYDSNPGPCSGPLYRSLVVEGNRARLAFAHVGQGLVAGAPLDNFEICGADGRYMPAQAKIDGKTLLVWSEGVPAPVAVRYAWKDTASATLFNSAGLPASSFCTAEEFAPKE